MSFGSITFDGANVYYVRVDGTEYRFTLSDVAAIGAYTSDSAEPFGGSFLVFVPRRGNCWWVDVSMSVAGSGEVLLKLFSVLETPIDVGLTMFASSQNRILWPASLAGQLLFTFYSFTGDTLRLRLKCSMPETCRLLSLNALSATDRSPDACPKCNNAVGHPKVEAVFDGYLGSGLSYVATCEFCESNLEGYEYLTRPGVIFWDFEYDESEPV